MDYRIYEPAQLVVAARRDVKAALRTERGDSFYFLEDPLRNKFFRLGRAEYELFAALDGKRTVADAVADVSPRLGAAALTLDEALALAKWLVDAGLATTDAVSM